MLHKPFLSCLLCKSSWNIIHTRSGLQSNRKPCDVMRTHICVIWVIILEIIRFARSYCHIIRIRILPYQRFSCSVRFHASPNMCVCLIACNGISFETKQIKYAFHVNEIPIRLTHLRLRATAKINDGKVHNGKMVKVRGDKNPPHLGMWNASMANGI